MNKEAYSVWISLFDESIASTWLSEPQVELKNAAMVLCVLKKEFQAIQEKLEQKLNNFRKPLESFVGSDNTSQGGEGSSSNVTENLNNPVVGIPVFDSDSETSDFVRSSPVTVGSPKINRHQKIRNLKKHRQEKLKRQLISRNSSNDATKSHLLDSSISDIDTTCSLDLLKKSDGAPNLNKCLSPDLIEATPVRMRVDRSVSTLAKTKFKSKGEVRKKKKRVDNSKTNYVTLTQMFSSEVAADGTNDLNKPNLNDATSSGQSLMDIEEMIGHLHKQFNETDNKVIKPVAVPEMKRTQNEGKSNKGNKENYKAKELISPSFAKDYDKVPQPKRPKVEQIMDMQTPDTPSCNNDSNCFDSLLYIFFLQFIGSCLFRVSALILRVIKSRFKLIKY